jgi:Tol biopolymer transport system component/N-acetylneuraminic acid mutarotase
MKLIIILGLLWSHFALADLVYMKEDQNGKSIMYQKSELTTAQTINDLSSKSWAIYPDITPDGDELIYAEGPTGQDLHLTYHDLTKNLIQRFHASQKGMILHPKFSKNGKFIFYSAPGPQGKNTIYFFDRQSEVNRQGGKLLDYSLESAKALDESEEAYFPRPSSDGNFLVYQRNSNGKKEIIFYDRIENKKTVLADGMSPSLSFDERWVAYTSKKDGHWNIYVTERTSGVTIQVTSDEKDEMAPTFLPDNTIAFASNKSGHFRLFKIVKGEWISLTDTGANEEVDLYSPQFTGDTTLKQTLKAPFIGNPRSSFGSVSHQGKIYMAGGHQGAEHTYPPESFSDQFIVYNPDSNSWLELAPRPVKAHGYQLAAYKGYIYAFGGFSYSETHKPKWKSLDQIDRYDIANNKWETIGNLLTPRSSNAAIKIQDKVYLAGGWNSTPKFDNDYDGVFLDTIEVFDLKSQKIELAHYKLPLPLRRAFTGIEYDGKLLLIGGLGQGASHFDLLNNVTSINPVDGFSQELSPLPFPTFAPAAEILNQKLFVFGGMYKNSEMDYNYVSHIYSLDLALSKWNHTGRCLKETKGFSQVFKLDDKTLGILGGHHYFEGYDLPVSTFETLQLSK